MRIRSVKPAFWSDSHISDLAEPTRLFYIGLWMIADDAGWLRWDAREVGNELYGYETVRRREPKVQRMLDELVAHERVVLYPCGHVLVPHLADHQHLAGATKQVKTVLNDHMKHCVGGTLPPIPAEPRTSPNVPATGSIGKGRLGKVRLGDVRASANGEEPTEFALRVPRPA